MDADTAEGLLIAADTELLKAKHDRHRSLAGRSRGARVVGIEEARLTPTGE